MLEGLVVDVAVDFVLVVFAGLVVVFAGFFTVVDDFVVVEGFLLVVEGLVAVVFFVVAGLVVVLFVCAMTWKFIIKKQTMMENNCFN